MIRAEHISFAIGDFRLRVEQFEARAGEYFVLLGPPGSGKSILLECLCGLKRVDGGRIYIAGRDVTSLEPGRRGIGYVPQDYALFPHLSVERNINFGLRVRGMSQRETWRKTTEVAEMLGIRHLLGRKVAGLSGGEQQRVALARALAISPNVLLLDEPVSALDESTRESVCMELRRVQQELGVTTVHVSHNVEEAFSVADLGGILVDGSFHQIGKLSELLRRPQTEFVARFMRCENLLSGTCISQDKNSASTRVRIGETEFLVPGLHQGEVKLMIRPENIRLSFGHTDRADSNSTVLPVKVVRIVDRGAYMRMELAGPVRLVAHMSHARVNQLERVCQTQQAAIISQDAIHVLTR